MLGSRLVSLLRSSAEVLATDRAMLDLSQPIDEAALPDKLDAVVYLAQSRHFRDFPERAGDILQVNLVNAVAMADRARRAGARCFVYASTGGVYAPSDAPLTEYSSLAQPMGFYPASKRATEQLLMPFAADMTIVLLRYFFIYGAGQAPSMLIPRIVDNVREGRAVLIQAPDGLRINPIHVDDAARATAAALALSQSATINVAGPEVLSLRAVAEIAGAQLGTSPLFKVAPGKPGHLVADTARMTTLLGATTKRLDQAIAELV